MVVIAKCATTTTLLVLSKAHLLLYMAHVLKEQASLQDASVSKHKDSASITIICRLCVVGRSRISFCTCWQIKLRVIKKIFQQISIPECTSWPDMSCEKLKRTWWVMKVVYLPALRALGGDFNVYRLQIAWVEILTLLRNCDRSSCDKKIFNFLLWLSILLILQHSKWCVIQKMLKHIGMKKAIWTFGQWCQRWLLRQHPDPAETMIGPHQWCHQHQSKPLLKTFGKDTHLVTLTMSLRLISERQHHQG